MKEIRVVIFDDLELIRNSLEQTLKIANDIRCVGVFSDFTDVIKRIEKAAPDVILMDIVMPGMSGIDAVRIIKENFPPVQILMQTIYRDDEKIFESIVAGASGYLLKNALPEKLIEAIQEVHSGGVPFSPEIARKVLQLVNRKQSSQSKIDFGLSEREVQVLNGLLKGQSYKLIADECFVTIDTIKFHIKNVYSKLHVHSKSEAIIKAINHKIF